MNSSKTSSLLLAIMAIITQGTIEIDRVSRTRFHLAHFRPRNPCNQANNHTYFKSKTSYNYCIDVELISCSKQYNR